MLVVLNIWNDSLLTLVLSAEWMSTSSTPAATMMREGAIRRNPLAKMGAPDTSHDPLGHSLGYIGPAGTFRITHVMPRCSSAPMLLSSFVSHHHMAELFIQVCVSSHSQQGRIQAFHEQLMSADRCHLKDAQ